MIEIEAGYLHNNSTGEHLFNITSPGLLTSPPLQYKQLVLLRLSLLFHDTTTRPFVYLCWLANYFSFLFLRVNPKRGSTVSVLSLASSIFRIFISYIMRECYHIPRSIYLFLSSFLNVPRSNRFTDVFIGVMCTQY